ncbi:MAG TPA: rhomboid family intramembrane serine protease [Phycisphaerales bacterium]|nr:rhomboid family intramembrane serine protease [Phycisphaerales bacterium]
MGIHDRRYYREDAEGFGGAGRYRFKGLNAWSVTTWIIVINVAVFVIDSFMGRHGLPVLHSGPLIIDASHAVEQTFRVPLPDGREVPAEFVHQVGAQLARLVRDKQTGEVVAQQIYLVRPPLEAVGHFSTYLGFARLEVWRLVTFQFLHEHASIWHLVLNMFGLYMFGTLVEEQLGRRRYLAYYLVCGIFGGITYLLLNLLGNVFQLRVPGVLFDDIRTPLIGASAGVFGVIMACAKIAPNMPVYMLLFPFPLRMKWLAYAWVGIAAFNLLFGGRNAGGDAAHLGGAIAGAFFIRHSHLLLDFFDVFGDSRQRKRPGAVRPPRASRTEKAVARGEAEIDAILDKVKNHGLQSLTPGERKALSRDTERRRRESGG